MQKNFPQAKMHLGNVLIQLGRAGEAVAILQECCALWQNSGLPKYILCFALAKNGQMDEARALVDELVDPKNGFVKPYFAAMGYLAVGEIGIGWPTSSSAEEQPWEQRGEAR